MKKLILFLVAGAFAVACNNSAENANSAASGTNLIDSLKSEVMALHDKVMPEMTPMSKMQGDLMQASIGSEDSLEIMTAATELKFAKDAMMKWMHDYSGAWNDSWSDSEKAEFLKAEKDKMARIDEITQKALVNGKAMLNKLENAAPQDSIAPVE